MHHLVLDRWSQGSSAIHNRDPRTKVALLLVFLIAVATSAPRAQLAFVCYAALLLAAALASRLPLGGLLARAALVLPVSATVALAAWWTGDAWRALALLEKSYLSGLAALLLMATTPLPGWTAALDAWHCPRALLLVLQFVYRYLFVIAEQAQRMRQAARCRGGGGFRSSAGAVGVLFERSWERADGVHRAILARGFQGRFGVAALRAFGAGDALFLGAGAAAALAIRLAL